MEVWPGSSYPLGATFDGRHVGTFGEVGTLSFYPAHHITMGEGGAVFTSHPVLRRAMEAFRDWGRDCWCASGKANTCNKRFDWQLGELPHGYDHKYIYSHIGYNLKPLDPQAAIGIKQLGKLPNFVRLRKENWQSLRKGLSDLGEFFEFSLPTHAQGWSAGGFAWDDTGSRCDPSWFGFMMLVRPGSPFSRTELAVALDQARIGNFRYFNGVTNQNFLGTAPTVDKNGNPAISVAGNPVRWDMKTPSGAGTYCFPSTSSLLQSSMGV